MHIVMEKERSHQTDVVVDKFRPTTENEEPRDDGSCHRKYNEAGSATATCRVCQCFEPDKRGNIALRLLGVSLPPCDLINGNEDVKSNSKATLGNIENNLKGTELVEFISPSGEVFICNADVELGLDTGEDRLIELGCSCKGDLALSHYACALKWFISHGSTMCEICGSMAKNIRSADFKKILGSLKEYEVLRERIFNGEPNSAPTPPVSCGVDPDAIAAIRRQRLSEISLWFNPHNNCIAVSQVVNEQPLTSIMVIEEVAPVENTTTKWAVEGTGILLATGLLTVTIAWLLAPHVGKKTAKNGLHILLGGICALTVVVFFRFFVLTRIKYGPARYWAILFVFWFLVFGIWASRTHDAHST